MDRDWDIGILVVGGCGWYYLFLFVLTFSLDFLNIGSGDIRLQTLPLVLLEGPSLVLFTIITINFCVTITQQMQCGVMYTNNRNRDRDRNRNSTSSSPSSSSSAAIPSPSSVIGESVEGDAVGIAIGCSVGFCFGTDAGWSCDRNCLGQQSDLHFLVKLT